MTSADLASRLIACSAFRWMPGMIDLDGNRYQWHHVNKQVEACNEDSEGAASWTEPSHNTLPDLTDPATIGCVLALVREAGREHVSVIPLAGGAEWHALHEHNPGTGLVISSGPTEAEALVAALEAAPKKE